MEAKKSGDKKRNMDAVFWLSWVFVFITGGNLDIKSLSNLIWQHFHEYGCEYFVVAFAIKSASVIWMGLCVHRINWRMDFSLIEARANSISMLECAFIWLKCKWAKYVCIVATFSMANNDEWNGMGKQAHCYARNYKLSSANGMRLNVSVC